MAREGTEERRQLPQARWLRAERSPALRPAWRGPEPGSLSGRAGGGSGGSKRLFGDVEVVEAGLRCLQWNRNSSPRTGLNSITLPAVPTSVDKPRPGAVTGPGSRDRMVQSPPLCRLPLWLRDPEVQPSGPSGHGASWGWKGGPGSCCENPLGRLGGTCHRGHLPGRLQLPPAALSGSALSRPDKAAPWRPGSPDREERGGEGEAPALTRP